jgi:hypothetical protein
MKLQLTTDLVLCRQQWGLEFELLFLLLAVFADIPEKEELTPSNPGFDGKQ